MSAHDASLVHALRLEKVDLGLPVESSVVEVSIVDEIIGFIEDSLAGGLVIMPVSDVVLFFVLVFFELFIFEMIVA